MIRRVQFLLALLAWCCLVSPWQSCLSDCREGALQPVGHGCHPAAEATSNCHCDHHDSVEADVEADVVADTDALDQVPQDQDEPSPSDSEGGAHGPHRCEGSAHASIVFQQAKPEPESRVELGVDSDRTTLDPWPGITAWQPRPRLRVAKKPLEPRGTAPPGTDPPRLRQLRVDVLLI